jgi:primosomal protein N'
MRMIRQPEHAIALFRTIDVTKKISAAWSELNLMSVQPELRLSIYFTYLKIIFVRRLSYDPNLECTVLEDVFKCREGQVLLTHSKRRDECSRICDEQRMRNEVCSEIHQTGGP